MSWLADRSLRQKLMLVSLAPTLVALAFVLASNSVVERRVYREILRTDLLGTARILAFNSAALLEFNEKLAGVKLLEAAAIYPDIDYASIFDREGNLFSEYHRPGTRFDDKPRAPMELGTHFGADSIYLYHPIVLDDDRIGTIYLHSTLDTYNGLVRRENLTIVGLLFISAVFALFFAIPIQRLIYNPVTQLAGAARTISHTNDYSLRVVKQGNDELGDLVDQFNRMLKRIQEQNSALKRENIVREGTEQQLTAANEELQFEIGQRIQAEGQLGVLLDDLEKKNAELQDFAYVVSHDLKAPLRGISSLTTWLLKDYGDQLDEKGVKYLNQLKERTRRMHAFIEGILQYSRLGRAPINRKLIDSHHVVDLVVETLSPPSEFVVRVPAQLPMIYYDKLLLLQVFQNLIGNALQHMGRPEGSITITCAKKDAFWEFAVEDTGVGIEERHHERIFRIFQSLHKRDEGDSSGIGLTLVKKIVERNGGEIRVQSAPGMGTTFFFTVPIRAGADLDPQCLTIYILDANEEYAKHTAKLLVNLGHRVRTAPSWKKGKPFLEQSGITPDVLLVDHTNLGTRAEDVLEDLFHMYPESRVIACIPEAQNTNKVSEVDARFSGRITKPFTLDKMNAILNETGLDFETGI